MASCHYTADSAVVSAFRLYIDACKDRQRGPEEQVVLAVHALARRKSANEAIILPSPLN
ncbi:hypothetical protein [Bradyrhizobium sp. Cp5.3]|uniref:hypothetical protein n=1 Tax=Bradyrhizobium sp. Cp5.3 TaxID=443598 RepID=UPI00040EE86E|nr:hypothetical protein [Bradyrhizobium sp. Cp5.3]